MDKTPIKNRHGLTMFVRYEAPDNPIGELAIIQHGFSGSMDEKHIRGFADTFLKNGYDVLLMDCTHSFNDADGTLEQNTIKTHSDDLEDVIAWAGTQDFYKEPFALAGHSLGGMSVLHYAQNHPEKISLLVPASTVISGKLLEDAFKQNMPSEYNDMLTKGKMRVECTYKDGIESYRPYSWLQDMQSWNMLDKAAHLNMPCLFVVGADDAPTPPEHQKLLFDLMPGEKELHIIDDADHCYEPKLDEALVHLDNWLQSQKARKAA